MTILIPDDREPRVRNDREPRDGPRGDIDRGPRQDDRGPPLHRFDRGGDRDGLRDWP